jgi:tripartite-type tricarboxylate transporter receptor subunit TctC
MEEILIALSRRALLASAFVATALMAGPALADYPDRTITMIVPFAAGGSTDTAARIVAEKLSGPLGQQVIVENRPGAGGNLGAGEVIRSDPDGYTILMTGLASLSTSRHTEGTPFKFPEDLRPVSMIVDSAYVLVAGPDQPFNTLPELIAYDKAHPNELNFGTPGLMSGAHLGVEDFKAQSGVTAELVHFQGNAPTMNALLSGAIDIAFDAANVAQGLFESGKVKVIAYTGEKRSPLLPDVPTASETIPGFTAGFQLVIFTPKDASDEVVNRLAKAVQEVVAMPDVADRLNKVGMVPVGNTPEEFAVQVQKDVDRVDSIVKRLREQGMMK